MRITVRLLLVLFFFRNKTINSVESLSAAQNCCVVFALVYFLPSFINLFSRNTRDFSGPCGVSISINIHRVPRN
ncbi:MAG: hypothetical protein DMG15_21630 [Acidobacteria bacterium]|nr:MAG: hypothetical protein DMG16_20640 [Acidobacteriota bacterium]PYS10172.1 MAG: hypothetical protein DMG15_21630 [Acidobacteriota bacterium]